MYKERRLAYLEGVAPHTLSLFFSGKAPQKSSDQHYLFSVNRNFFYLTGLDQENVVLLLAKGDSESKAYLFIEPVDPVKALWDGAGYTFGEASDVSEVDVTDIRDISTLDTFITQLTSFDWSLIKHDVGNYSKPIPEGALITVEPGLYIAEEGIGIRMKMISL